MFVRHSLTKRHILAHLVSFQTIGYCALLILVAGDELFDFPHTVFGQPATPINYAEIAIECGYIFVLGALSLFFTMQLIRRVKFFEGLIPICSYCKKIREENRWLTFEEYVIHHSEAIFSHGICPECRENIFPHHSHPHTAV